MKTHDLSTVLHNHADLPETAHAVRMAGLHSRVRRVRRRRAFVAMACALLVLVGGAVVTTRSLPDSQPAAPEPFPEYWAGSKVLAQTAGASPGPVTLDFTPTGPLEGLGLAYECAIGPEYSIDKEYLGVTLSIDGHAVYQDTCGRNRRGVGNEEMRKWWRPGQKSVVRLTVAGRTDEPAVGTTSAPPVVGAAPDGVGIRLAVKRTVPVRDYPLPPPPEKPLLMDGYLRPDADIVLRADPADPNREQKVVVPWRGVAEMHLWTGSPGRLRVVIGGTTIHDYSKYDYSVSSSSGFGGIDYPNLVPGEPVEISVLPEAAQGDWLLMLVEGE
ncbi:MAG: hypothetical protein HOY78_29545 [Saccharothrix sp.]|nr:hypothetical protein [Saccharothrix sp.]